MGQRRTYPQAARVQKQIAFSLGEWDAVEQLLDAMRVREFSTLCRIALAEAAEKHEVSWPYQDRRAS